jgi:hypothetical protein
MGKQFSIPGIIELSLANQRLHVANAFQARLANIFPGDPLSEVFIPPETARSSKVSIPVLIRITYPIYPLIILVGAVLAMVATLFGLLAIMGGEKRFEVVVDGQLRKIAVKPFNSTQIRSPTGEVIGTVKRGLGRPVVSEVVQGHSIAMKV